MQSKLTGVRSWLLVGFTAGLVAVPLYATSGSAALNKEELRTAFASTTATPNRQRTVQIGPRDTLWSIARATRPDNSVTIKQAMLAIRDANPKVFPSKNINEMELGTRLIIPSVQTMKRLSAMEAEQEVRRQNQAWVASKDAPPVKATPAPKEVIPKEAIPKAVAAKPQPPVAVTKPVPDPVKPPQVKPPEVKQPEVKQPLLDLPDSRPPPRDLTLVAPTADEVNKANEAANKLNEAQQRISKLQNDLASSEENLYIVEREKDELAERISNMQQQVSTLQQLIQLKDQQLTDMETQLALEQGQPSANNNPIILSKTPELEPDDLVSQIKRQPLLYGALAGSGVLLLALLAALISARRKLKAANKLSLNQSNGLNKSNQSESNQAMPPIAPSMNDFDEEQASSDDFDVDLNDQPLAYAEGTDHASEFFDEDDDFDLDSLEDEISAFDKTPEIVQPKPFERDALQEAETFIAYGRLEQAAGFLQTALTAEPDRENLRVKLLEVLVELNDEETFRQQQQQLEQQGASIAAVARAEELASFFVVPDFSESLADADDDFSEMDLDEMELGEMELGEDEVEQDDLDLYEAEPAAIELAEADLDALDDMNLDDRFDEDEDDGVASLDSQPSAPQQPTSSLDDFNSDADDFMDSFMEDLVETEMSDEELDTDPATEPPLPTLDEFSLNNDLLDEHDLDEVELDRPELNKPLEEDFDLVKPLDATELADEGYAAADFEPVDYRSDADDFMEALDNLALNAEEDDLELEDDSTDTYQAPGVDEELAALNENLAELEAFSEEQPEDEPVPAADTENRLDDLSDFDDLDDLDDFSSLGDLGDLELNSVYDDLATQLDLATAYTEMGDKEGAREILEKVVEDGDADLRATALQMLEALSY